MSAEVCTTVGCTRPARMALRTTRPTRDKLQTVIYYDNRSAPKTAQRYCKQCGMETATALCSIVDNDEEVAA